MNLDTILNQDCLEYMRTLPDSCIDLVMTSPPYAMQRKNTYGGIPEDQFPDWFAEIGKEIQRILKPTGSFVLNIKEHCKDGQRSTYVLKTVLKLSEILLWNDTYIWYKPNPFPTSNDRRLKDGFEYCYLFTKTKDYKFNIKNVLKASAIKPGTIRKKRTLREDHLGFKHQFVDVGFSRPSNVLEIALGANTNQVHPAMFPEKLPEFFIKLLTDPQDVVYDPFAGSGTTLMVAKRLSRHYLGTEIVKEYTDLAETRINSVPDKIEEW